MLTRALAAAVLLAGAARADDTENLLQQLADAHGPPGFEERCEKSWSSG